MPLINKVSELNDRIDILEMKTSEGPEQGQEGTLIHSCWAQVKTSMIKEIQNNVGTLFEDTTTFVIRSQQPVTLSNKMNIHWKDKYYNNVKLNADTSSKEFDVIIGKEYS